MSERLNIKNLIIEPERSPERPFDPERDVSQELRQRIKDFLKHQGGEKHNLLSRYLAHFIFPQEDHVRPAIDQEGLLKTLARERKEGRWLGVLLDAALLKISGIDPQLNEQEWQKIMRKGDTLKSDPVFCTAMRVHGRDLELTLREWEEMKGVLQQRISNGELWPVAIQAAHMEVLTADEVRIPPNGGLELVWKKDTHKPETPPQPLTRNF